ncbi:MAG: hypothetical protein [Bacteriophage sp.]|nr:MAG: hypothetical protein [Bacteriophage sp.]
MEGNNRWYNEDLKKQVLKSFEGMSNAKALIRIFNISMPYEIKWQKDLCNFVYSELADILYELNAATAISVRSCISYIRRYNEYCLLHGESKDGINHADEFIDTDLTLFVNKFKAEKGLVTREEMEDIAESLKNPMESMIIVGAFEGLTGSEMGYLQELDVANNPIHTQNREIAMSDLFIFYAQQAAQAEEYIGLGVGQERPFAKDQYCIKFRKGAKQQNRGMVVARRIYSLKQYNFLDKGITLTSLKRSGLKEELEKKAMLQKTSLKDVIRPLDNIKEIAERYGYNASSRIEEDLYL